jgi:hypothetical protein
MINYPEQWHIERAHFIMQGVLQTYVANVWELFKNDNTGYTI